MTTASRTLGNFNVPTSLPVAEFDSVNERVAQRSSGNEDLWYGFASAWNGVVYRMRAALDHEKAFSASVAHSTAPLPDERYRQDHDLFGFVVSAVSAIDCFYFAAYRIGSLLNPHGLSAVRALEAQVLSLASGRSLHSVFPGETFSAAMQGVLASVRYEELGKIRNVLAHRGTPPRMHLASTSWPDTPSTIPSNLADLASSWRYDFQLSPQCLVPYKGLARKIARSTHQGSVGSTRL